jgi:hypothetical protein
MSDTLKVNEDTPQFLSWFESCRKGYEAYLKTYFPSIDPETLEAFFGPRYVAIRNVKRYPTGHPQAGMVSFCSAWAFIDRTNGDVLKVASYRAPAKGVRGNIFDESNGMVMVGPYGPTLLRGGKCGNGTFAEYGLTSPAPVVNSQPT